MNFHGLVAEKLSMAQEPISLISLDPITGSASELMKILGRSGQVELFPVPNSAEAHQASLQFMPCVLVLSIADESDGHEQLALLKGLEKSIRSGQLKVMVISAVKAHPLAVEISGIGVTDYSEEPVSVRALMFKMNLALKAVLALRKQAIAEKKADEKMVFKADEKAKENELKIDPLKGEVAAKYKPALQLGEDIFVFRNTPPRKTGKKFILQAEGPAPETGEWKLDSGRKKSSGDPQWRWVPKPVMTDEGIIASESDDGWMAAGEQPVFNDRTKKWQFRSEKPRLYLRNNGECTAEKVTYAGHGEIVIAEDSNAAINNLTVNRAMAEEIRDKRKAKDPEKSISTSTLGKEQEDSPELLSDDIQIDETQPLSKEKNDRNDEEEEDVAEENKSSRKTGTKKIRHAHKTDSGPLLEAPKPISSEKTEKALKKKRRENAEPEKENSDDALLLSAEQSHSEEEAKWNGLEPDGTPLSQEENTSRGASQAKKATRRKSRSGTEIEERDEKEQLLGAQEEESTLRKRAGSQDAIEELDLNEESDSLQPFGKARAMRAPVARAREKALARLREIRGQATSETAPPLPDAITPEEERRLRHDLGLGDESPLSPREIHKKARLAKLKAIRKEMADIENSLAGNGPPIDALFPDEEDEVENQRAPDSTKERNFRAIDSIDEDSREDFFGSGKRANKEKPNHAETEEPEELERLFYLERNEVLPLEGIWECENRQWLYVPSTVYETGFKKLEDLLPTWLYEGSREPSLEENQSRWVFRETAPIRVTSEDQIPDGLQSVLEGLRVQACLAQGIDPGGGIDRPLGAFAGVMRAPGTSGTIETLPDPQDDFSDLTVKLPTSQSAQSEEFGTDSRSQDPAAQEQYAADADIAPAENREGAARPDDLRSASDETRDEVAAETLPETSAEKNSSEASENIFPLRPAEAEQEVVAISLRELVAIAQISDLRRRHHPAEDIQYQAYLVIQACLPGWTLPDEEGKGVELVLPSTAGSLWLLPPNGRTEFSSDERAMLKRVLAAAAPLLEPSLAETG